MRDSKIMNFPSKKEKKKGKKKKGEDVEFDNPETSTPIEVDAQPKQIEHEDDIKLIE